jgi:flavin-dependent thymidylate synthase
VSGSDIIKWGDSQQYYQAPIQDGGITVRLLQAPVDPLGGIAAMCRMYEGKPTYSLNDISHADRSKYWQAAMETHLKAPLEAVTFHFFIEGVDRAFTHQMVRQRTACYAQESMRFAVVEDLAQKVQLPLTIRAGSDEAAAWERAITGIQEVYDYLVNNGVPAEEARGLLPHCTPTRLNYITNLRSLLEHAGNRLCTQAQFVWRVVFAGIIMAIRAYQPTWQYQHIADAAFRPVCYQLGHCPFKASFDRACTIRGRVDEGKFDEINAAEWMADPSAARA